MSFLYQALLKEKEKENTQAQLQQTNRLETVAEPFVTNTSFASTQFAGLHNNPVQSTRQIPWFAWLIIGLLLLFVGLLAGFIYGNGVFSQQISSALTVPATVVSSEKTKDVVDNIVPTLLKTKPVTPLEIVSETNETAPDKTIEIALDNNGVVVSQVVTDDSKTNNKLVQGKVLLSETLSTETQQAETAQTESITKQSQKDQIELDKVPDKLKSTFADAVKATEKNVGSNLFKVNLSETNQLTMLNDLPSFMTNDIPELIYQMHIFSSDVSERWVKINGKTLYEGSVFQDGLTLLEIKQELIVWRLNAKKAGQLALVDFIK